MRTAAAGLGVILLLAGALAHSASTWVEGKHYFPVRPAQATAVAPGKVEVAEALSYGCPACASFLPVIDRLKARLPANAEVVYVPASFNAAEQWPMFQRAYVAAQTLGIVDETHEAMFNAVWSSGELAVIDPGTRRLKTPPPTIEDVAAFYERNTRVDAQRFLATAKSFSVELGMKRADAWIKACRVDQTPTMVVNGKYRLHVASAGGVEEMIELVTWLVEKEGAAGASR